MATKVVQNSGCHEPVLILFLTDDVAIIKQ